MIERFLNLSVFQIPAYYDWFYNSKILISSCDNLPFVLLRRSKYFCTNECFLKLFAGPIVEVSLEVWLFLSLLNASKICLQFSDIASISSSNLVSSSSNPFNFVLFHEIVLAIKHSSTGTFSLTRLNLSSFRMFSLVFPPMG